MSLLTVHNEFTQRMTRLVKLWGGCREMSRRLDLSPATVSRMSTGHGLPDFISLYKLGQGGIDLNWLVMGKAPKGTTNYRKQ